MARVVREAVAANHVPPMRSGDRPDSKTEEEVRLRLADEAAVHATSFVPLGSSPDLGRIRDIIALSQAGRIDQILIAVPWSHATLIEQAIVELRRQALPVMLLPDLQSVSHISRPAELAALLVFELKRAALGSSELLMKRTLDASFIAMVALARRSSSVLRIGDRHRAAESRGPSPPAPARVRTTPSSGSSSSGSCG